MTRAKQRGNPEFAFLDPGGEGEEYYAWLRHALRAGIDPKKPPGVDPTFDPVALAAAARKIAERLRKVPRRRSRSGERAAGRATRRTKGRRGDRCAWVRGRR